MLGIIIASGIVAYIGFLHYCISTAVLVDENYNIVKDDKNE